MQTPTASLSSLVFIQHHNLSSSHLTTKSYCSNIYSKVIQRALRITYSQLLAYSKRMRCILGLDSIHSSKMHGNVCYTAMLVRGTIVHVPRWFRKPEKVSQGFGLGFELWWLDNDKRKAGFHGKACWWLWETLKGRPDCHSCLPLNWHLKGQLCHARGRESS